MSKVQYYIFLKVKTPIRRKITLSYYDAFQLNIHQPRITLWTEQVPVVWKLQTSKRLYMKHTHMANENGKSSHYEKIMSYIRNDTLPLVYKFWLVIWHISREVWVHVIAGITQLLMIKSCFLFFGSLTMIIQRCSNPQILCPRSVTLQCSFGLIWHMPVSNPQAINI